MPTADLVRIGLVGCGAHSRSHHAEPLARYAADHPGSVELAAVCDLDHARAEAFRDHYGFAAAYSNLEEMVDHERLDGVMSVMPISQVVSVGRFLLERGIPCTIEKPLGTGMDQARELEKVAEETGTAHLVSVNRRYMPMLDRALEWARRIGQPRLARATLLRSGRSEARFMWGTGSHAVDTLHYIGGDIAATGSKGLQSQAGSPWFDLSLDLGGGIAGHLTVLPTCGCEDETYEIFGEGYAVRVRIAAAQSSVTIQRFHKGKEVPLAESHDGEPAYMQNGAYEEVAAFIALVKHGRTPKARISDVVKSLQVCADAESHVAR